MEDEVKRWTAKRKSALMLGIIQSKTTVAEASRSYDLSPAKIETWVEDGKRGMENALRANPLDIKDLPEAYGEAMIEQEPSYGHRMVAHLLGFNKNTVQRVFQLMGWQVKKRPIGFRPRIQAMPSVAAAPNERWSADLCRIWAARDSWATLALVIGCHTRELLGWHLPSVAVKRRQLPTPWSTP